MIANRMTLGLMALYARFVWGIIYQNHTKWMVFQVVYFH